MTKEHEVKAPAPASRKHEARLQKEKRQKKIMIAVLIAIVAVVVVLVGYGVLQGTVLKNRKPVAKVGSTTINVNQFVKRVQYERLSYVETFTSYAASGYAMFFESQMLDMQNALDNYIQFGSDILDKMINEAVVAEKAAELGISVTDEDINKELERGFGFFPEGTPTPEPTYAFKPTSTLSAQQLAIITITPTASPEPTATTGPTQTPDPSLVTPTAENAVPTATQIPPTPTAYTREGFEGLYDQMLTSISDQFPYTEADFREYVRNLLLNQKVFEEVTKDISRDQEMIWARHILVTTEEEANAIIERLEKGEDFGTIAAELSIDTSTGANGGDLSWFSKGQMVEPFENAAYALEIGEVSEPVQSDYGFHIIQLLGKEIRALSDQQWDAMKQKAFAEFIENAKTEISIKKFDVWASVVPNTPAIPAEYRMAASQ
ncbi:MAG TPA: peptidylprolyl isomerase [Anaerolineaceae bacterium]|nr:peptidylprolyl isomerase [Anaerolineaceae bacterium]